MTAQPRFPDSFIVGVRRSDQADGQLIGINLNAGTMREMGNILVCGAPGAGKTVLLTLNLLSWRHSAVVLDLKGTVYRLTANYRRQLGQKVYVIDPRTGTGHRFNPLAVVPYDLRRELAAELVAITNEDPFWSAVAVDMWLACWAAADHAGEPHMPYAMQILNHDGVAGALQFFLDHHGGDERTMQHVLDFYNTVPSDPKALEAMRNSPDRLLGSKWTTVKTTAGILNNENMLRIFSGHDIDVEGLFYGDGQATIYIQADETNKRQFMAFSKLVMKALGDALIREGDREAKRRPVLFLFDEFGEVRLNSVSGWLNTMRSRDIILALFIQKLSQLSVDGKPFDFEDENSFHHFILFKPTNQSGRIAEAIKRMSGVVTRKFVAGESTSVGVDSYSNTDSYSYREKFLIDQDMIESWPQNYAYCNITARTTLKFIVEAVRPSLMGWEMPEPAEPLPDLPPLAKRAVGAAEAQRPADVLSAALAAMH